MWRADDTIRHAVECLLNQTFADIKIVVTNDGGPPETWLPLAHIDDTRLIRRDLPHNRGRYWIDHDVLHNVCDTEWFAIHDADDWAEPDWLESLLACVQDDTDVVLADHWVHPIRNKNVELSRVKPFQKNVRLAWHAHMAGLWRSEWAREHHVTCPHVRVGWDSVMTGLPYLLGNLQVCTEPKYHRVRRHSSLTNHSATGINSPLRRRTIQLLEEVWSAIVANPTDCASIVANMRLDSDAKDLVRDPKLVNGKWSLDNAALAELDVYLWSRKPKVVVECGSGVSTLVLARYAQSNDAKVVSLEHDARWANHTGQLLFKLGLQHCIDLRHAPLSEAPDPWYQTDLPDGIEFVLIDGPPLALGGRAATFPALQPHLADDWEVWLDDADRPEEQAALKKWKKMSSIKVSTTNIPKGLTVITKSHKRAPVVDATGVVVTMLTGHRPKLLAKTLDSIPKSFLKTAHFAVLHDGGDTETTSVLARYEDVIDDLKTTVPEYGHMHSIGHNMSVIADMVAANGMYWMHLEDDWVYSTMHYGWLDDAVRMINRYNVSQVRLRHMSDPVLPRHQVTRRPIQWQAVTGGLIGEAHLTFNPALMPVHMAHAFQHVDGETMFQRKAFQDGHRTVAQAYPGVFHHIGDQDSMRKKTGTTA